jgi:hypothetical protein
LESLLGTVLIILWVGFNISRDLYRANQSLDSTPAVAARRWSIVHTGDAKQDYCNQPIVAPSSWWKDVPVKDVLMTGGEEEVLVDEIREFVPKFRVCIFTWLPLLTHDRSPLQRC